MKTWTCKIGEVDESKLPPGSDLPMRLAVEERFEELTGEAPAFIFSGWAGVLTESERAVVENRLPDPEKTGAVLVERLRKAVDECADWNAPTLDVERVLEAAAEYIERGWRS